MSTCACPKPICSRVCPRPRRRRQGGSYGRPPSCASHAPGAYKDGRTTVARRPTSTRVPWHARPARGSGPARAVDSPATTSIRTLCVDDLRRLVGDPRERYQGNRRLEASYNWPSTTRPSPAGSRKFGCAASRMMVGWRRTWTSVDPRNVSSSSIPSIVGSDQV